MMGGSRTIGVVLDPVESLDPRRDSTVAMLEEAAARGWLVYTMELGDLMLVDGRALARASELTVAGSGTSWYRKSTPQLLALGGLDAILMRKDPPVDFEYITATYILERAAEEGCLVANNPRALRDENEKLFATRFPGCCPESIVTRSKQEVLAFLQKHGQLVLKPLQWMAGRSVYLLKAGDPNSNAILEDLTRRGQRFIMAQHYLPAIATAGDKRIILIDGNPFPYAFTRFPAPGDCRANLAAGGRAEASQLTGRDREICSMVGPELRRLGVRFAGLDVIGDYLTEINITSPTGIRQIDNFFQTNISADFLDSIEETLAGPRT